MCLWFHQLTWDGVAVLNVCVWLVGYPGLEDEWQCFCCRPYPMCFWSVLQAHETEAGLMAACSAGQELL